VTRVVTRPTAGVGENLGMPGVLSSPRERIGPNGSLEGPTLWRVPLTDAALPSVSAWSRVLRTASHSAKDVRRDEAGIFIDGVIYPLQGEPPIATTKRSGQVPGTGGQ
jgi:hypothetical protein